MTRHRSRGVTAIEMIIAVAILAIVLAAAMPSFTTVMTNQRIRTATESLRTGLQLARMEALKRGQGVIFNMGTLDSSWSFGCETPVNDDSDGDGLPDCPSQVQTANSVAGGTGNITITTNGGTRVTFSPIGLVRQINLDGSATFSQINVTAPSSSSSSLVPLRVLLPAGGLSRICDPHVTADGDTRKC